MLPVCNEGFRLWTGASCSSARAKSDIGRIECSLEKGPKDLPCIKCNEVARIVIPADVHQPDAAALPATANVPLNRLPLT